MYKLAVPLTFFVLLVSCDTGPLPTPVEPTPVVLEACHPAGIETELQCGEVEVPESWSDPAGRTIPIVFTILPAPEPKDLPPLFYLTGGPGSGTVFPTLLYTGSMPFPFSQAGDTLWKHRNVVLIDHRGTGRSAPLHCPQLDPWHRLEPTFPLDVMEACRDRLSETADLTQYSTAAAIRDVDAVRAALGYETVDLIGGSYGTSWALAYLREYPERVRRAVLQGVLPLDNRVPLEHARNAQRVLEGIFERCATDETCDEAFPNLQARFETLIEELERSPVTVEHQSADGSVREIVISRGPFVAALRGLLTQHRLQQQVPFLIDRATKGDFKPLVAQTVPSGPSDFAMGLYLSTQCPTTRRAAGRIETATAGTWLGSHRIDAQLAACQLWPEVTTPDGWYEPVKSDVPALLITGADDHETPAEWAEKVAATLPEARTIVIPSLGHAPFDVADPSCYLGVIDTFLTSEAPATVDVSCLAENEPMSFFFGEA